jgi:nucleotide-binding universal stress UspA family protein
MTSKPVIYVGVDASWRDTGALEWALQEALLRHKPLRAVHVVEERLRHEPYWEPADIDHAALNLVKEVQTKMESTDSMLDHEAHLMVGPPAATLASLSVGSDMLVVGRRGRGIFKRLLIGSTSESVASQASVPVVVVPDGWKATEHSGPVLVALDDSGDSEAAIEFAAAAATERHVRLRMVHVLDLPNIYSWDTTKIAALSEEWSKTAQRHFEAIADQWRHRFPELKIEVAVIRSHPVEGVIAAAESAEAQLVVVGARHRRRLNIMLLGSVARGVLQHATCPVAVAHAPSDDA